MVNSNKDVVREKSTIMETALLNAMAYAAMTGNQKDEISDGQAWKTYGKAWVVDRTERGWIHFIRNGCNGKSTKVYSRFEIECQKRAEKHISEAYKSAEKTMNQ